MHAIRRLLFLLTLCCFLSGCSGYREVALPGEMPPPENTPQDHGLKVGTSARVWLKSGQKETGEILAISDQDLTLGKPSNYGLKLTLISFDEIAKVEVPHMSPAESAVVNALGIMGLVATVGIVLLGFSMRNASWGS